MFSTFHLYHRSRLCVDKLREDDLICPREVGSQKESSAPFIHSIYTLHLYAPFIRSIYTLHLYTLSSIPFITVAD